MMLFRAVQAMLLGEKVRWPRTVISDFGHSLQLNQMATWTIMTSVTVFGSKTFVIRGLTCIGMESMKGVDVNPTNVIIKNKTKPR